MRKFIPLVVITFIGTQLNADTFRAINWLYVVPLTPDTFEVIEDRGAGARGIWCAAADYVQAVGRDHTGQRMYVLEPRRPSKTANSPSIPPTCRKVCIGTLSNPATSTSVPG